MSKKLKLIKQKVEAICFGLLRCSDGDERQSFQVSTSFDNNHLLNCTIQDENEKECSLLNRKVSLIQKNDNDYLYLSGQVDEEVKDFKIVSLRITKACWYVRKRKGNVVWLQEKCMYQVPEETIEKAS